MSEAGKRPVDPCSPDPDDCASYGSGHQMHFIHAKQVGLRPWGWRDGVVTGREGEWIGIGYVGEAGGVRVWHHRDLAAEIRLGDPVRVHEELHAVAGPFGWLNVAFVGGLGPVPEPAAPELWASETSPGIVDAATGRGVAIDHDPDA